MPFAVATTQRRTSKRELFPFPVQKVCLSSTIPPKFIELTLSLSRRQSIDVSLILDRLLRFGRKSQQDHHHFTLRHITKHHSESLANLVLDILLNHAMHLHSSDVFYESTCFIATFFPIL